MLVELGEVHHGRKTIQPAGPVIRKVYSKTKSLWKHDLLMFDSSAINTITASFADTICRKKCASAIRPDHVHLLIRRHRELPEAMIEGFQSENRVKLIESQQRSSDHPV